MKLTFIGAGAMAEALFSSFLREEIVKPVQIFITNHSNDQRLEQLQQHYGVSTSRNRKEIVQNADVIFIATLPQQAEEIAKEIAPWVKEDAVIISILAGVSIQTFEQFLPKQSIARLMPNTPAQIGLGASGIAWNDRATETQKETIHHLLASTGVVREVSEDELHTVTALSGSGPAYVYFFIEALEHAAVTNHELDRETARALAVQTVKGAATMIEEMGEEPSILREKVTSPGGTTAAGLQQMMCGGFVDMIENVIDAARMRSEELGK